jgi:hypothetical protein
MFAAKVLPQCLTMSTKLPETGGLLGGGMIVGGAGMGRLPKLFGVGSRLVLEIMPSVAATVIGGYLLGQLHFGRNVESSGQPVAVTASTQLPTIGQDRAAMSQVLKERREKPEKPAQVKVRAAATAAPVSVAAAASARRVATASIPLGMDSISPREPVARPVVPSRPSVTAAAPVAPAAAPRPDAEAEVYVPAPPPGLPPAPPRGMDAPTVLVPSVASAAPRPVAAPNPPPAADLPAAVPSEPGHQGPVGVVFSTFSNFVGHAANATGHTVNWVIDLPGKAISAGGRAIGVSPPPPPPRPLS